MTIAEILNKLKPSQVEHLQYAFEHELSNQYVEYTPGRFIGVNIVGLSHLSVTQTAGYYSAGLIIQGQKDAST